ncbi:MAG: hypothetical protein IK118_06835 [Clostridia bacterium]|nr:hypothetical protein [Clostridia bacterium]
MNANTTDVGSGKRRIVKKTDIAALLIFAALIALLALSAVCSWCGDDELLYNVTCKRFGSGDRPLVDDWPLQQLSVLFSVLPYRIFYLLNGGSEGMVFFLRCCFIAADAAMYWFFYLSLRKTCPGTGMLAAGLFCASPVLELLFLNYYNLGLMFAAVFCFVLFREDDLPPSRVRLIVSGVVFFCAALCQPAYAAIYVVFLVMMLRNTAGGGRARRTASSGCVTDDRKAFLLFSVGVAAAAAALALYLAVFSGVGNILANLPGMMMDSEHTSFAGLIQRIREKLLDIFSAYSVPGTLLLLLFTAACAIYGWNEKQRAKRPQTPNKKTAKRSRPAEKASESAMKCLLFCGILLTLLICWVIAVRRSWSGDGTAQIFRRCTGVPIILYAVGVCLLSGGGNRRMRSLVLLAAGFSLAADLTSASVSGFGGSLALFPAVFYTKHLIDACRAKQLCGRDRSRNISDAKKKLLVATASCAAALFLLLHGALCSYRLLSYRIFLRQTAQVCENVETGPMKHITASSDIRSYYDGVNGDLDLIAAKSSEPFFSGSFFSYAYLYLDLPVGAPYGFNIPDQRIAANVKYWQLHPDRVPEYIYVIDYPTDPTFQMDYVEPDRIIEILRPWFDFTVEKGSKGTILHVTEWRGQDAS